MGLNKNILQGWEGRVVVLRARDNNFPAWKKNRTSFLYNGIITDENLREILPNELIIEFDKSPDCPLSSTVVRSEAINHIRKIARIFENHKIWYRITDHGGVSPHLRTIIEGLEEYPHEVRKDYKKRFLQDLLDNTYSDRVKSIIVPDWSLVNTEHKLVALEGQPHFKTKYKNHIEDIITEPSYSYMRTRKELLRTSSKPYPREASSGSQLQNLIPSGFYSQRTKEVFLKHYKPGQRHYFLSAFCTMMRRKLFSLDDALSLWSTLKKILPVQEGVADEIDIRSRFMEPLEFQSTTGMLHMFLSERDVKIVYFDMLSCFKREGDDLDV